MSFRSFAIFSVFAMCIGCAGTFINPFSKLSDSAKPQNNQVGLYSFYSFENPNSPRELVFVQSGDFGFLLNCPSPKLAMSFGFSAFEEPTLLEFTHRCLADSFKQECTVAREILAGGNRGEHFRTLQCNSTLETTQVGADFAHASEVGVYLVRYTDRPLELLEPGCKELLEVLKPANSKPLETSLRHLPMYRQIPIHCRSGSAIVAPHKHASAAVH